MGLKLANNAISRLSVGISPTDVTIVLVPGGGAAFPTLGAGDYFPATIVKADGTLEIVKVTARASDVLTVVRAQENTTAKAFNAGDRIELRMTAGAFAAQDERITTLNNLHPSGTALTPLAQWSSVPQMVTDNADLNDEINAQAQALANRTAASVRWEDTIIGFDATGLADKSVVYFKGRDAVGDGGGGPFRYSASSTQPEDGGTVFAPTGGGRLFRDFKPWEKISYEYFPATSAGLNTAVTKAIDNNIGQVNVSGEFSVNGTEVTEKLTQIEIVGEGAIIGPYRKWVIPHRRGQFIPTSGISPAVHLQKTTEAAAPVVVMMGDSISTEGADAHALTHSMWSIIKEQFQKQNPNKAFTFHNRAIGGQTWLHANTKPTAFPYWYTNTTLDWLTYIESLQPDCVVLAFGMNDSNGFNSGAPHAVVSKIKAWAKVPDIVFVTNPVPAGATVYPDGTGFGFRGQTFQEGRDLAAGYVRSYASFFGHGLIDINRAMVAMRDGYDTHSGIMRVVETVTPASGAYTAVKGAHDFAIRGVVNGATWAEGKVLAIKSGLDVSDFVFVTKTGGNFVMSGFAGGVSTYKLVSTGVSIPSSSFGFEFSIVGGIARLLIDPTGPDFSSKRAIAEFPVIRGGGLFLPVVSWQGEAAGPFASLTYITGYGTPKFKQVVTDEDVWGPSDISPDIKPEFGGNGINHYSAKGVELVVRPAIEACDFSCPAYTSGIHSGGRWAKYPDGTAIYSKKVTWTGNIAAPNGSLFLSNDAIADTDFPNIFMSDGASGSVFQSAFHVMSDGANFVWVLSGGVSRVNNAIRYRLASTLERTGITVDIHITMTGRWK